MNHKARRLKKHEQSRPEPFIETGSFKLYRLRGYISTLYLADYGDRMLLLDCGSASDVERIEQFISKLGHRPGDIKLAVVSHMHPDHAGGAQFARSRFGCTIVAHPQVDLWYRGITGFIQHLLDCYMAQLVALATRRRIKRVGYRRKVNPDYPVMDRENLPIFPDWSVLHVPGHTTHDIALYNMESGILYCADCIIHVRGRLNLPIPVFFTELMKESIAKLAGLGAKLIIPAHGDPILVEERPDVFGRMTEITDVPHNRVQKRFHRLSNFAPDVWRWKLREVVKKRFKRVV